MAGFISVAVAATLLGIVPSIQKQLLLDGLPMTSLLFFTDIIIAVICLGAIGIRKTRVVVSRGQLLQALVMGIMGMLLTPMFLNMSYLYLPVGTATMLNFLYPSIVCVAMGTIFRKGFTRLQLAAVLLSIGGLFFLTGGQGELSAKGVLPAVISAFTYGGYLIANEKGEVNQLPLELKLLLVVLPAAIGFGAFSLWRGTIAFPGTGIQGWLQLILGSGVFTAGGYALMMYGIKRMGASNAAFVSMVEPIVGVIGGTLWFGDKMNSGILCGGGMIVISILCIAINGHIKRGGSL